MSLVHRAIPISSQRTFCTTSTPSFDTQFDNRFGPPVWILEGPLRCQRYEESVESHRNIDLVLWEFMTVGWSVLNRHSAGTGRSARNGQSAAVGGCSLRNPLSASQYIVVDIHCAGDNYRKGYPRPLEDLWDL
jgi:hypothetical protein